MERHTCRPDVSPLKQMIMKRVKHLLLASCLLPTFLGAQGVASASFLEITPDAQSAGMAGTGLAITDNGSTAIFHNASTIAFSQDVMGASYSYADINKDFGMHSASLFYRIGREGKHGFSVGFRHYKDADFHWQDGAEDHARGQQRVSLRGPRCQLSSQHGYSGRNGFMDNRISSRQPG